MPRWKTGWITALSILNGPFDPNGCHIPSACRIHPFLNGNSRMWGLKIPLSLYPKDILHRPIFYMFATLYAEHLNAIHKENKWNGWISSRPPWSKLEAISAKFKKSTSFMVNSKLRLETSPSANQNIVIFSCTAF